MESIIDNHRDEFVFRKIGSLVFISICYTLCDWSNSLLLFSSNDVVNRKNQSCKVRGQDSESFPLVGQDVTLLTHSYS